MGYLRRHAILVTDDGHSDFIDQAHAKATEIFPWVSPISPEHINGERSFFVPPDGSKEGWNESDLGDKRRDAFVSWLDAMRYEDHSSKLNWCEVQYGDDEGKDHIVRTHRWGDKRTTYPEDSNSG